ncbi:hypothetical protein GCM10010406_52190 [Streptomyces thermolineatus]|uniref:Uncharacterized protein n=1 Tax=Streptomyces thermolineatus TaxID=44033 RepID=A0ABP6A3T7_9ACTN
MLPRRGGPDSEGAADAAAVSPGPGAGRRRPSGSSRRAAAGQVTPGRAEPLQPFAAPAAGPRRITG